MNVLRSHHNVDKMNPKKLLIIICFLLCATFIYNEFLVYHLVLSQCRWPSKVGDSLRVMLLADPHLLGPFKGHWFDKLRREWQMKRAFQSSIWLHQPDAVFILGDVFDEGQWVNDEHFNAYLLRFYQIFHTYDTKVYSIVGNHDVGFHYKMHPYVMNRFKNAFNESNNAIITIKNNHFILLNSMALSQDGCYFCSQAEDDIRRISVLLNCAQSQSNTRDCKGLDDKLPFYVRPILLQHFPTFRESDKVCEEYDIPEMEIYRENWEVLSRNATKFLGDYLNPLVSFSGHSHHYCRLQNTLNIEEFTIASFSWRNKNNPSFLLAEFSMDNYAVSKCDMPNESTVILIYTISGIVSFIVLLTAAFKCWFKKTISSKKSL